MHTLAILEKNTCKEREGKEIRFLPHIRMFYYQSDSATCITVHGSCEMSIKPGGVMTPAQPRQLTTN